MADEEFSADKFAAWIRIKEALAQVTKFADGQTSTAAHGIIDRLRNGLLTAAAKTIIWTTGSRQASKKDNQIIDASVWIKYETEYLASHALWRTGDGQVHIYPQGLSGQKSTLHLYDVRIDPKTLSDWVGMPPPPPMTAPANRPQVKHAGGAPRKDFWDDLWADIASQLYSGDLKPEKQADIEAAMLAWASDNGEELGEATARRRAAKLWKLIQGS